MTTVSFVRAAFEDAEPLTTVQKVTFDDDAQKYLDKPSGGPPGYDDPRWLLKRMEDGKVYKIVMDGRIVGGIIVFRMEDGVYNLGRIWVHPDYQNHGIGTQAILWLEAEYPQAARWTLDTPIWATRNHHFYEKMGYVRVGMADTDGCLYEKRIVSPQRDGAGQ